MFKMESIRKIEPLRKLNTKGCCFLCLKTENINQTEKLEGNQILNSFSILPVLRHLQLTAKSLNGESLIDYQTDIKVELCESCGQMMSRFSVLFQKLENIKLEINYLLEKIHKGISQSAKDSELVQNYSKRMTSDFEALSQLVFVDNLRKQVAKESLRKSNVPRLQLVLTRVKSKLVKSETNKEKCETSDEDTPEHNFCNEISPPPSPNSAPVVKFEEELKLENVSTSSFEQQNLSHPLLKQNPVMEKKIKYSKKHPPTGMYKCTKCDKKSHSQQTIADHFKSVHLKLRHKCDICNVSVFSKSYTLALHKKTCREKLEKKLAKEKDPKFKFICKFCGKRFEANSKLHLHVHMVHKNMNRFQCDLCDKKYTSRNALKRHQAAIHQSIKIYCKICNKMFKYIQNFKRHETKCVEKAKIKVESVEYK